MRACSAVLIHPDVTFRIRVGGLLRRSVHPIFLAADAAGARGLLEEHPGVSVVAVADEAGGQDLLDDLCLRRASLRGFVLSDLEASRPAGSGLALRLEALLAEAELRRERRLRELIDRRLRRRISRAAERLADERLESLSRLAATGTGGR